MNQDLAWTRKIIGETLKKKEYSLDINGADKRILDMCCSDFNCYIKWIRENNTELQSKIGKDEMEEFIYAWVNIWWKKYKERVKIVIKLPKMPKQLKETLDEGGKHINKFSREERKQILTGIIETLLQYGEVCAGILLANNIYRRVLGRYPSRIVWTLQDKINLLSEVKREAKIMSYVKGPFILFKPDRRYYRLREFKKNGNQTQGL